MKKENIYLILIMFLIILFYPIATFALGTISIFPDKNNITIGEEFEVAINSEDMEIASFQLEMYFDSNKIECVPGTENFNIQENIIIYTWFDETGGNNPKESEELVRFKFKAKNTGEAVFGINGLFFDKEGNSLLPTLDATPSVVISEVNNNENENIEENSVRKDNTYLDTMRLGIEGISPDFDKNWTEYTLIINPSISNLNIEAVPENSKSTVNIHGNTNLKNGINKINIEVISEDGTQKRIYAINVTKTSEPEKTNTNLETLAVEYFALEPETLINNVSYKVKVPHDTEKINIFAVPESRNATVSIQNKEKLDFGENIIAVAVTAENGITVKNYIIKAYRMTNEEEEQEEKEQEENAQRLDEIVEEQELERLSNEKEHLSDTKAKTTSIPTLILLGMFVVLIGYLIIIKKIKIIRLKK